MLDHDSTAPDTHLQGLMACVRAALEQFSHPTGCAAEAAEEHKSSQALRSRPCMLPSWHELDTAHQKSTGHK